jgi:hypothetical protein
MLLTYGYTLPVLQFAVLKQGVSMFSFTNVCSNL